MEIFLKTYNCIVLIDNEDFNKIRQGKALQIGRDGRAYIRWYENKKPIRRSIHRIIMNAPNNLEVDHINGNPLDNRKENLRLCNSSQNKMNKKKYKGKFPYKGIKFYDRPNLKKKWYACINANKKKIDLGYHTTMIGAAIAYDIGALKYHKQFAVLNFPFTCYSIQELDLV